MELTPARKAVARAALKTAAGRSLREGKNWQVEAIFLLREKGFTTREAQKIVAAAEQHYRDNPDDGGLSALGTGVLVLAAVGITYLMFREKPGKEPEPAPAPTPPAPTPPPVVVPPPVFIVKPPPFVCTINLKRFNVWLASKDGFKGVWLDNVQTTPPILSVLRTDHPALVGTPWSKTVVATHGGSKIWRYHEDGEPFTEPGFYDEYCAWLQSVS